MESSNESSMFPGGEGCLWMVAFKLSWSTPSLPWSLVSSSVRLLRAAFGMVGRCILEVGGAEREEESV